MDKQNSKAKMLQIVNKLNELNKSSHTHNSSNKFSDVFNHVLESLHGEYKEIIQKTFVSKMFKFWWAGIYSKSSFYRLREKALRSFINLFEMIYENITDFAN